MANESTSIYEYIGGADTLWKLVSAFYDRVAADADLRPIFPEDFTEVRERQYHFLTQFFGGPHLYTERYGHPMLRARHMGFEVTPVRAKAWLRCMAAAMDEIGLSGPVRELMFERLTNTAIHMVNTLPTEIPVSMNSESDVEGGSAE